MNTEENDSLSLLGSGCGAVGTTVASGDRASAVCTFPIKYSKTRLLVRSTVYARAKFVCSNSDVTGPSRYLRISIFPEY